jgi:hypothetical protein
VHLHGRTQAVPAAQNHPGAVVSEINSLLYSGAVALDPVLRGVAQGLSALFPPIAHPDGRLFEEEAATQTDAAAGCLDARLQPPTKWCFCSVR